MTTPLRSHALLILLTALGCTSQMVCRRPDGPPQTNDCVQQGDGTSAAVAAGANAVVWASGNGCQLSGCHPTLTCNQRTGLCERPVCGEGDAPCPLGTVCNRETQRCQ